MLVRKRLERCTSSARRARSPRRLGSPAPQATSSPARPSVQSGPRRPARDRHLGAGARGGRAAPRVWLGDWAGAVSDASLVPIGFVYQAHYSAIELDQYNRIYWANANQPYRNHSVIGTFVELYYQASGDPRTPWKKNPAIPNGNTNVPWYFETKFDRRDSPINLASGREM